MSEPIGLKALVEARNAKEMVDGIVEGEVDKGVLRTKIDEKLNDLEEEYAPELNSVKSQLAQKANKGNISVSDINKNLGKFDQTYMSDELLRQIAGDAPINAVVDNLSQTTNKLSEKAVTPEKTSFIKKSSNLFDNRNVIKGTIQSTTGVITDSTNNVSQFISILPETTYTPSAIQRKAFYDENRSFITSDTIQGSFSTPTNAFYIRIQATDAHLNTLQLNEGSVLLAYEVFYLKVDEFIKTSVQDDYLETDHLKDRSVTPGKTSFLIPSANLFNKETATLGKSINTSGAIVDTNNYAISDFMEVSDTLQYTMSPIQAVACYDADENFITRKAGVVSNTTLSLSPVKGTKYIRVNLNLQAPYVSLNTTQINKGDDLLPYEEYGFTLSKDIKGVGASSTGDDEDTQEFINKDHFVINGVLDKYYRQVDAINNSFLYLTNVFQKYDDLMAEFPDYITKTKIGDSYSGIPIYRYDFKPTEVLGGKTRIPKMFIVSGTHGAERVAVATLIHVMSNIAKKWKTDETLDTLKWNVHFIIVPISNPDGWESYGGSLDGNARYNMNNVDINRNFPPNWSVNLVAPGAAPFSEPESQALKTIFDTEEDIIYFCDFHNFSARTSEDLYYQYIWNIGGNKFNINLTKTLIRNASREWKKRYNWVPQDDTMFGYTGWTPAGTIASYASSIGLQASTFEVSQRFAYATVAGLEEPADSSTWTISNGLAVETFTNWLILNLRNNIPFYNKY